LSPIGWQWARFNVLGTTRSTIKMWDGALAAFAKATALEEIAAR